MRVLRLLGIVTAVLVVLAACPLPYDFSGEGAGNNISSDPSSPNVTSPVSISYAESGGANGTIENGGTHVSGTTTTVTLSTSTENAVIYYTEDGSEITNFGSASKISASSGSITVNRTTGLETRNIHAVAVGSGMLPSPPVQGTITVTPFPVLTISADDASIPEDGGATAFRITSSRAPDVDLAIALTTGGDYEAGDISGLGEAPGGPGGTLAVTLAAGTTSVVLPFSSAGDAADTEDDTVTLNLGPGSDYSVGSPGSATVVIQDNQVVRPTVTLSVSNTQIDDTQTATFTVQANPAPQTNMQVNLSYTGIDSSWVASTIYNSVPILAGQTTATFTLDPAESVGFEERVATYRIDPGTGYLTGNPSEVSVVVTDDLETFGYVGYWDFDGGNLPSPVGTQTTFATTGSVAFGSGVATIDAEGDPNYDQIQTSVSNGLADLDKSRFTLGLRFRLESFSNPGSTFDDRAIIVGGASYRWLRLVTDGTGRLVLRLNGTEANAVSYTLTGLPQISAGTYYTVVLRFDITPTADRAVVSLSTPNGFATQAIDLGNGYVWDVESQQGATFDEVILSADRSTLREFDGSYDWIFAANGLLSPERVLERIANDPLL